MSSTTMSIDGSITSAAGSVVSRSDGMWAARGRRQVAHRDPAELEAGAALDGDGVGAILEHADQRRPDVPATEHGDADRTFGGGPWSPVHATA